jgi:pyruvate kinase
MLYRGVYPESFDIVHAESSAVYQSAFEVLLREGVLACGDVVLFTTGDLRGIAGRTNTLKIIEVPSGNETGAARRD